MRTIFLSSLLVLMLSMIGISAYAQGGLTDAEYQKQILFYVNKYRQAHHLPSLKMNDNISQTAKGHSIAMADQKVSFGHTKFNERIKHLYKIIPNSSGGAENVAYYKKGPKELVDAWIASRGHRHNILGNYNQTGIGIAHNKKGWGYYTQIFIKTTEPQSTAQKTKPKLSFTLPFFVKRV